jgi:gamma-glutamyltranspeptidase
MAERLREHGQRVTIFLGEGMREPVHIVTRRRDLKWILRLIKEEDPEAFYTTEYARDVSKVLRPTLQPSTGWRAITKKK